ncbi:MAG: aldo/keto reductase [Candidatus Heimdallarchaeota archaeon]|nr:aldo/keto reductase [Candidatus Heimdallarchaeota archaeon]MDH5646605.1 aldo/keto reductase [Candidatus Heimdallarchaeota archaeon]
METRKLGRINFSPKIITLGGCGVGKLPQEEADNAIELAFKKYKLNMIDVAPSYAEAEIKLQPWISNYRKEFFIAEKTLKRTKDEAWDELQTSLKRTGTDYFDLYQFHAVGSMKELHQILGPNGAMEAFIEARESGIIKHIGITGHANIEVFVKALDEFDFDTVLAPVTLASKSKPDPANDFHPLLEKAIQKKVGIIAIKAIMKRRWQDETRTHNTWYEPLSVKEQIDSAIWYTLSQRGVTTYSLPCDVKLWPMVLDAGVRFKQLNNEELIELENNLEKLQMSPLFPYQQ